MSPDLFLHALDGFIESMYHNSRADLTFGQNYKEFFFTQPQNDEKDCPQSANLKTPSVLAEYGWGYIICISLNHRAQYNFVTSPPYLPLHLPKCPKV